ncbi:hypothetical protein H6G17_16510 [Chroococcidiopsis sp. FACHB-1243]|uniref:hypothetical protein n=1 Tax=Chroococcidiopsis sp. [FACHB-1243] TaxID=2692781 RepID=UPI00177ED7BE|nr:hypothetical protein [Chroococcidiopsis sp. [FACHB-1243]]MBD2307105.1 hypothetical protein [Chroococcidiopsis sp. [FACHB-1243]]
MRQFLYGYLDFTQAAAPLNEFFCLITESAVTDVDRYKALLLTHLSTFATGEQRSRSLSSFSAENYINKSLYQKFTSTQSLSKNGRQH